MKVRIHFTYPNGEDDSVVLTGDDVDELREEAHREVAVRNGTNPWSEILEE